MCVGGEEGEGKRVRESLHIKKRYCDVFRVPPFVVIGDTTVSVPVKIQKKPPGELTSFLGLS